MNIEKLAGMFGVKTYEEENKQLHSDFDTLAKAYDQVRGANNILAKQVVELEDREQKVKEREEQLIEIIAGYEEAKNKCEYMIDNLETLLKRAESRGINTGRAAAYSELGIWNIEAHENGNRLVIDACGDVYELLELQDVKADDVQEGELTDEIIIDDLVDVGA